MKFLLDYFDFLLYYIFTEDSSQIDDCEVQEFELFNIPDEIVENLKE